MATNKWLNALEQLKDTTNTLRQNLRNGGVSCSENELLENLVAKVPTLAPKIYNVTDNKIKWEPDPLWVFPDPNGSGQSKTIREIYDEDTMASSYTYRGVYLIYGYVDTIDLKAVVNKTTSSFTFITSDGARYNDVAETSLMHTWDKNKDVIDSNGRPVRYVKLYTNANTQYVPGFYRQLIWAIHNLGSGFANSTYTNYAMTLDHHPYECLELESNFGRNYVYLYYNTGLPKKLVCNFNASNSNYIPRYLIQSSNDSTGLGNIRAGAQMISELTLPQSTATNVSFSSDALQYPYVRKISIQPGCSTIDLYSRNLSMLRECDLSNAINLKTLRTYDTGYYVNSYHSWIPFDEQFYLDVPETVTTLQTYGLRQKDISLPENLASFTASRCCFDALTIPDKVSTLTLTYLPNLYSLTLPLTWGTTSNTTQTGLLGLYNLRTLIIPQDFNRALSVSDCKFLTHDCLVDILYNLRNNVGTSARTLTLGTENLAKLSDEEKAIATNKNWTLA